ncbi:MAG: tetratricopeptide repeat protein [bacterium]|nr:tetratricopeptide repeat protein [bacterium]
MVFAAIARAGEYGLIERQANTMIEIIAFFSNQNHRASSARYTRWYVPMVARVPVIAGIAACGLLITGCQSSNPIGGLAGSDVNDGARQKGSLARGSHSGPTNKPRPKILASGARQNLASLSEVVRRNPTNVNALNMRGTAFAKSHDYERALADFNAAIDIDPQYYQAYGNRALVYIKMGRIDLAKADYEQALRLSPQYTSAYLGRGRLHMKSKNYAMALADFRQTIKLDPSNAIAYFQRGATYQLMGQHENAISDFNIAIGLKPKTPQPYFARGQSRFELQQYETAYDDFYIAAKRSNGNARAWTYRGLSAERFGDPKKAVRAYRRALKAKPYYKPALEGMKRLGVKAA